MTNPENVRNRTIYSQTLDRGIRVLHILAAAERKLSIQEVATGLGVHRSIAYRILRTLERHRLVERDAAGRYAPGVGLAPLARSVKPTLQSAALPEMSDLAGALGMTAFLVVRDHDEAVTIASVEPRHSHVHVAYRPGVRHPVDRGAPGLALLAGGPARPGERREVTVARKRGWATSFQEVLPGMRSVAAPIPTPDGAGTAAVAVVYVGARTGTGRIGERVMTAARAIAAELG
ncbi:transcriptional regulator [Pseudonocardia asaccharolytica DSM 44247 = NBRC 16224]|uniref:Transcriptional regulator n=2 Tax=Pseudonocardia asaccharolytica TaxID=54010 RepID=A0A511CWM5_9PSEU|nr:transcriptional regulator [Pseudonocardia asaccharolytica DSM 44247 = NBRC 16224]